MPPMWKGAPLSVFGSPSKAASFSGWSLVTVRAAQSPTISCAGVTRAAKVSGMIRATRL